MSVLQLRTPLNPTVAPCLAQATASSPPRSEHEAVGRASGLAGDGSVASGAPKEEQPRLPNWRPFLEQITKHPRTHARWLNTLALMEHTGSRKMLKALDSEQLDLATLEHIAEETRHAAFFKGLSQRVSAGYAPNFETTHLFCGIESRAYFQDLDRAVEAWLHDHHENPSPRATYLGVTVLIEERATMLYQQYEYVLTQKGFPFSLRSVLLEEEKHLAEMQAAFVAAGLDWEHTLPALRRIEAPLFSTWYAALYAQARLPMEAGWQGLIQRDRAL